MKETLGRRLIPKRKEINESEMFLGSITCHLRGEKALALVYGINISGHRKILLEILQGQTSFAGVWVLFLSVSLEISYFM